MTGTGADDRGTVFGAIEVQVAVMVRNTELLRRRDVSPEELDRAAYLILRALCALGSVDINRLAVVLGLDASTVGRQIAALTDEGLVSRTPDPEDRRRATLAVSTEGRRRLEVTIALRRQRTAELLAEWSADDLERFGGLMARYNAAVADRYMTGMSALESEPGPVAHD